MRRTASGHGFLLCLLLNMMFRFEWAIVALVMLGVCLWLGWPIYLVCIPLAVWILYALFVTLVLSLANRAGNIVDPPKPNKNPYSQSNHDIPIREEQPYDDI